jgi:hypothetical protein
VIKRQGIAFVAALWTSFVLVVCSLPPNAFAGPTLLAVVLALALLYFASIRGKFKGPVIALDRLESAQNAASPAPVRGAGDT